MKKVYLIMLIIGLIVLVIPVPSKLNDTGSYEFKAILYKITKIREYNENAPSSYDNSLTVEILGIKVFDNATGNSKFDITDVKL